MKKIFSLFIIAVAGLVMPGLASAHDVVTNGNTHVLSLDGEWKLEGFNEDQSKHVNLTAEVPGFVHLDLLREGMIEDPFWRDNAKYCQWIEYWKWNYKKYFTVPETFNADNVFLEFDGLDTYTEIFLNGRKLSRGGKPTTENMFIQYRFDISGMLKKGYENVLEVKFIPIRDAVGDQVDPKYRGAFDDPYRVLMRKIQCTFGWDWVHRLVSYGIWQPCRIVKYDAARVENTFFYTEELSKDSALLQASTKVDAAKDFQGEVRMKLLSPSGKTVWSGKQAVSGAQTVQMPLTVKNPELWWPVGNGEQPIYTIVSGVYDQKGHLLHELQSVTGIRTVQVEQVEDKIGSSFAFIVNGRKIFCKGGNWIPADPFPSRVTEKWYDEILGRTADAGMNMLRVWGGGIYESDYFYEACDRLGIMIWQDFMMACGQYPEDRPDFVKNFMKDAEYNLIRLRNHPCIALWCGDNENGEHGRFVKAHKAYTEPMVNRLDPSRHFHLSSPFYNRPKMQFYADSHKGFHNDYIKNISKDGSNYRQVISDYSHSRFLSESTTTGAPVENSLLKFMTPDDIAKSEIYDLHTQDNPYMPGKNTLFGRLEEGANLLYGDPADKGLDAEGFKYNRLNQLQYFQYHHIRLVMEATRANKPMTQGILFWMLNDCWPASGWSFIDYYRTPKAAWYAMKEGCKSVIAATEDEPESISWSVTSDKLVASNVSYKIWIQPFNGKKASVLKSGSLKLAANEAKELYRRTDREKLTSLLGDNKMVVFEITADGVKDRSYWSPLMPKEINYGSTELDVKGDFEGVEGSIEISSSKWGRVVTLTGDVICSDNFFEMLPGETRTITWKSLTGEPVKGIKVAAWNEK